MNDSFAHLDAFMQMSNMYVCDYVIVKRWLNDNSLSALHLLNCLRAVCANTLLKLSGPEYIMSINKCLKDGKKFIDKTPENMNSVDYPSV